MGKSGAKVEVTEYYMSQHLGICTSVDALRKIIIKEKVAWEGYASAQSWWRIQEDELFGGATKEGGVTGTIYWLPGLSDQILNDELATRLGRANGADAPGYRGLASLFFTGRPDMKDGVPGFYWTANNPYLPGIWAEVRRAPVGLDPAYAMIPRAGSEFFPFESFSGLNSLLNSALTPDRKSLITTDNSGGVHVQVWDLASRTLVSTADLPHTILGHTFGVVDSVSFYAVSNLVFPKLYLFTVDGGATLITSDFDETPAEGCQYVAGQVFMLPTTSGTLSFGYYDGTRVPARTVGFNVTCFFPDANVEGQAWAIGPVRSGGDIGICQVPLGAVTFINTGDDTDCFALDNGSGQLFVFQESGNAYLVDKLTLTITHTSADATGGASLRDFASADPGQTSIWVGFSQWNTQTGELIKTVDPLDWKAAGSTRTIYDPVNNAIISEEPFTATDITWRDLDSGELDANPAHIIYECLTNTDWGMGSPASLVDFDNFDAVGVVLYNEPLGLSMLWTRQASVQDFIQEVLNHINGVVYVDPQTGLLTLKLIRGDYDVDDLPTISPSTANLTNFGRKLWGEIVNEVTVTWTNPETEQDETVTGQDLASITTQGGIVPDSRNYYGVRYALLAQALAARELRSAGAPLATCEAEVDRSLWFLRPASVLLVDWPEYGLDGVVMRVISIDYGKPGDPSIKLALIEDVFGLDVGDYVAPPTSAWEDTSSAPTAMEEQEALTLPYYFAANGITPISSATFPEVLAGVLGATSNTDTFNYELWGQVTLSGGGTEWQSLATLNVVARAELAADLAAEAASTGVSFDLFIGSLSPALNGFALIGGGTEEENEIAMITAAGSTYSLSRGVLDTVPRAWPAGTPVWFVRQSTLFEDPTVRSVAEIVSYRLRPRTSQGLLSLAAAPLLTGTLTERPWLPSRPANVIAYGEAFSSDTDIIDATSRPDPWVTVTWSNRNRTAEDVVVLRWTDATVAVEDGQTTTITVLDPDGTTVLTTHSGLTGTSFDVPDASFGGRAVAILRISAERIDSDGTFESLQYFDHWVRLSVSGAVEGASGAGTFSGVSSTIAGSALGASGVGDLSAASGAISGAALGASGAGALSGVGSAAAGSAFSGSAVGAAPLVGEAATDVEWTITVPSGKTASNLTDYPVYLNLADMPAGFWTSVAVDGGNILVKQSGSDIPFDVVKIDTGANTGTLFFKASSLLSASDNVFTLDLTGVSMPAVGDANGRNAVWSAFDWVWLGASVSAGAPEVVDRTGGASASINNGTFTNSPISLGAGCGVQNTSGVPRALWAGRTSRTVFTLAGTIRLDVSSITATRTALMYATSSGTRVGFGARDNGSSDAYNVWDNNNSWQGGSPPLISANNGVAKRLHSVYNGSTSRIRYVDGAVDNTSGAITARPGTDVDYNAGNNPSGTEPFTAGYMAFFYARPAVLSAAYIAAEYSNLNAPASFYTIA